MERMMNDVVERERILAGYLGEEELAAEFQVSVQTLRRWRRQRTGPPFTRVGAAVLYPVDLGRQWLRGNVQPRAKAS
jgi:hypothetical protein